MIPELNLNALNARDPGEMAVLGRAVREIGFLTVTGTSLSAARVSRVLDLYRAFFELPAADKRPVDMVRTGSNRGWGAPGSEQVDPGANPDFKEVFDCGYELPTDHPLASQGLSVYAPNLWPSIPAEFRCEIQDYYAEALNVGRQVLAAISDVAGDDPFGFDGAFDAPMALLRGNYYPERPNWAGAKDFGIAAHTDYGCLTLLAMDGSPGLTVQMPDGSWQAIDAQPGVFVINFGEMLEMWTGGRVKATLHRVVGGANERISVPLFLNPSYDTNVAPPGAREPILAGEHLSRRFNETYLHLKSKA
ncbi:isopenicillin N synthase family dioxygenase [Sedimentitalea todarodis]|uniref:2-oxoglutarate-dependent ethylene/succinate-forming enzyme n=1 Tax=Sedimentitalea todarodis TaxID=1631240 RepID=A0ABU3VBB1_9RHOB|nr:2-oxoglutarate and iron-dependent oxygenase domain-containing protein [Sedimentitalea todarodis]MDU9003452.1 2-oxoglutarate and iron-dependent oxygenase domain-containing protein [Sedimentitalea todarodis]